MMGIGSLESIANGDYEAYEDKPKARGKASSGILAIGAFAVVLFLGFVYDSYTVHQRLTKYEEQLDRLLLGQ